MGKAKGESKGLAFLSAARPAAMGHLMKFFGESGKHLEPKTRFLISIVTKVINFSPRGLQQYARRAQQEGASAAEILDAILCAYPCAGLTRVVDAVDVLLDMELPGFAALAEAALERPADSSAASTSPRPERWVPAAQVSEVPTEGGLHVAIEGRQLAIFRHGDSLVALDAVCPHGKGGLLSNGQLAGGSVTCPLHGWSFDVTTGACLNSRSEGVKSYALRIAGDRVEVSL